MDTQAPLSFWQRNKLVIKSFFIGFLVPAMYLSRKIDWYGIGHKPEEA